MGGSSLVRQAPLTETPLLFKPACRRIHAQREGAAAEYDVASRETLRSAAVAAFFYVLAGLLIVGIVLDQSQAIAQSAGWIGSSPQG